MNHKFTLKASDYAGVKLLLEAVTAVKVTASRGRVTILTNTPGSYVTVRAILSNREVPFYVH